MSKYRGERHGHISILVFLMLVTIFVGVPKDDSIGFIGVNYVLLQKVIIAKLEDGIICFCRTIESLDSNIVISVAGHKEEMTEV